MATTQKPQPFRVTQLCPTVAIVLLSIVVSIVSAAKTFSITREGKNMRERQARQRLHVSQQKAKKENNRDIEEFQLLERNEENTDKGNNGVHTVSMLAGKSKSSQSSSHSSLKSSHSSSHSSSKSSHSSSHSSSGSSSENQLSALDTLELAANAVGGDLVLEELAGLELEATGKTWFMFESEEPDELVATTTYNRTYALDFVNDRYRVDESVTPLFEVFALFPPQSFSRIVDGNVGGLEGSYLFIPPGTIPSASIAALKRQQLLFNPHLLLKQALGDHSIISMGGGSDGFHTLVIENEVSEISLYINEATGLIDELKTLEVNPLIRDTEITVRYNDWNLNAGCLLFPKTVELYGEAGRLWTEGRTFAAINMVDELDESTFDLPQGTDLNSFDADSYKFGLQTHHNQEGFFQIPFYFPFNVGFGPPVELATGLNLLPSRTNSLAIRHTNGVIIVEAPGSELQGMHLINAVDNLFPGTQVSHIIQSHHHVDHGSGVRQVLGSTGATLVVGPNIKAFWQRVLCSPSTIRPDSLSEQSFLETIEDVDTSGKRVVVDEDNLVVTVYHTDHDTHAKDTILTTIEADGMVHVFVADIYTGGFPVQGIVGGPASLFDAMREVGLINHDCTTDKPLTIVPSHGIVQTLEASLTELSSQGIDVGC